MTTIAWDGKTLAVDSYASSNEVIVSEKEKKLYINVGKWKAVAVCGSLYEMNDFLEWLKTEDGDRPKSSGSAFCVDKKGKLFSYCPEASGLPMKEDIIASVGSGAGVALGAMDAGATAVEALKIACKRDPYTGGRVRSYTHHDKRKVMSPAKVGSVTRAQARAAVKSIKKP